MNARFSALFAVVSFAVLATGAAGCSSEAKPVVSGGAQFQLQNPTPDDRGTLGACLDPSTEPLFVAQRGEDGQLKLVVDGADDSRVACRYDGGRFSVSVSRAQASLSATGTFVAPTADCPSGTVAMSADAKVTVVTPSSNVYRAISRPCRICFTQNDDTRLRGNVHCPLLEHASVANACATTDVGSSATFFSFAACSGY